MNRIADERGETLLEILITIMVMGVGMVAVVAALSTLIIGSDTHHGLAQGEVVVRDYGEAIKAKAINSTTFTPCPGNPTSEVTPSGFAFPSGWSVSNVIVEWWQPNILDFPNGTWSNSDATCTSTYNTCNDPNLPANLPACDGSVQRVTFTVQDSRTDYAHATITSRVIIRRNNVP
jgi:hypothetical protein